MKPLPNPIRFIQERIAEHNGYKRADGNQEENNRLVDDDVDSTNADHYENTSHSPRSLGDVNVDFAPHHFSPELLGDIRAASSSAANYALPSRQISIAPSAPQAGPSITPTAPQGDLLEIAEFQNPTAYIPAAPVYPQFQSTIDITDAFTEVRNCLRDYLSHFNALNYDNPHSILTNIATSLMNLIEALKENAPDADLKSFMQHQMHATIYNRLQTTNDPSYKVSTHDKMKQIQGTLEFMVQQMNEILTSYPRDLFSYPSGLFHDAFRAFRRDIH